jgi:hypothetical protein
MGCPGLPQLPRAESEMRCNAVEILLALWWACGGPPGSRSRHLGIKSARNHVSTGRTVSQHVLLSQVERMREIDVATSCNTLRRAAIKLSG